MLFYATATKHKFTLSLIYVLIIIQNHFLESFHASIFRYQTWGVAITTPFFFIATPYLMSFYSIVLKYPSFSFIIKLIIYC